MSKVVALEMTQGLRKAFKTATAMNGVSMKDAIVDEVNKIMDNNEICYDTSRPASLDDRCTLTLNVDDKFAYEMKVHKNCTGIKIRDMYITGIINYIINSSVEYDFTPDIKE